MKASVALGSEVVIEISLFHRVERNAALGVVIYDKLLSLLGSVYLLCDLFQCE